MFCKVRPGFLLALGFAMSLAAAAQTSGSIVPLQLEHDPQVTNAPPFAGVSDMQCNDSGTIYVHYVTRAGDSFSFNSGVTKIAADGDVEKVPISDLPDTGPVHVFQFAVGQDGSLHEIVRARRFDSPDAPLGVYYVTFDPDGTFHSKEPFEKEFVPSLLLPLPDGDFFSIGVTLETKQDDVEEKPLAGIFGPDAKLKRSIVERKNNSSGQAAKEASPMADDPFAQGGTAVLGSDGNIYVLVDGDQTQVAVVTQTGRFVRQLTLQHPFEVVGVATGMWISGGRILVTYESESDDPKGAYLYAIYDQQTGETLRLYRPEFSGSLACFDQGQSISVLMSQKNSGAVEVGQAELP